jgi:ATP-binding cassette subfamily B multidrug efflux pump
MRNILMIMKPYRVAMTIALSLMMIELMVELLQPYIMSKIIDHGIQEQDLSVVLLWGGILIGFSLLAVTAGAVNSFYSAHASQSVGYDIRDQLYEKVQSFSFANFNRFPTSSLITRMTNDVTQIQNGLFMALRIAMRAPLLVVGSVIMVFVINIKLALIFMVTVPLLLFFLVSVVRKVGPLFRNIQRKLDKVNGVMQENLVGMRLIKAFLRRKHEVKRFNQSSEELKEGTVAALRTVELTMPIILLIMNTSIIGILWFGRAEINAGGASAGEIVAIVNYAMRITFALAMVSMIIMNFARVKASVERISEVLEVEEDLLDAEGDILLQHRLGKIRFDSVSFQYPGTKIPVLQDISFEAKAGESIAILGATGSGKSSLFQLIPRLYDVDSGQVCIDDTDVRCIKFDDLRKHIGYVPQEVMLFTGTVKENILWGKEDASIEEVIEAAIRAQIHETIMKLPMKYDTVVGQKGVNLSGGQKQRLSIARALVRMPSILLLDDSTSALDMNTEAKLLEAIQEYPCTTLMITQKMSTAMNADSIMLIENGILLAKGSHEELWESSSLYRRIYQSQFGMGATTHA